MCVFAHQASTCTVSIVDQLYDKV